MSSLISFNFVTRFFVMWRT